jgi:hypothetical protein
MFIEFSFYTVNNVTYFPFVSLFIFELLLRFEIPGNIRRVLGDPFAAAASFCNCLTFLTCSANFP